MFGVLVTIIFIVGTVVTGQISLWNNDSTLGDVNFSVRQPRFFPFFNVVRFPNNACTGSNSSARKSSGTCFTKKQCATQGGTSIGPCANGYGVCCVAEKSCGSTTKLNNTYFINPGYPAVFNGGERCVISVQRSDADICQLRVDFLDFRLAQPNATGICDLDFFRVTGGSTEVPRICGENTEQHVYVSFDGKNAITMTIDTSADYTTKRRWNLRIQQIACDSPTRVSSGCLQNYNGLSGTIMSFNYGDVNNPRTTDITVGGVTSRTSTREIANLNYGACIRTAAGYCSIRWSKTGTNTFSITDDSDTTTDAFSGMDCTSDFVTIQDPSYLNNTAINEERFCGTDFLDKTSSLKPFVLYVHTDGDEIGDTNNQGFSLTYKQMICAI